MLPLALLIGGVNFTDLKWVLKSVSATVTGKKLQRLSLITVTLSKLDLIF